MMSQPFRIFVMLSALFLFALCHSCGEIELPEKGGAKPVVPDEERPDGVLTVAQALSANADDFVEVCGYIVGYVDGTSISETRVRFELPELAPNTNMLLADSPDETDLARLFPVALPTSTTDDTRDALNLYDNPDLFRQPIVVGGYVTKYFSRKGIKKPEYYYYPEEMPEPVPPADTVVTAPPVDTPELDDEEEFVPEGR